MNSVISCLAIMVCLVCCALCQSHPGYRWQKPVLALRTRCPAGEILEDCSSDCVSDYCTTNEADAQTYCSPPLLCPPPICKCPFNQRREINTGKCIDVRDCPPFDCSARPNEVYNPCPFLCPTDDCKFAPFNGTCPSIFINYGLVLTCAPRCVCAPGYYRNDVNYCVPAHLCPSMPNASNYEYE